MWSGRVHLNSICRAVVSLRLLAAIDFGVVGALANLSGEVAASAAAHNEENDENSEAGGKSDQSVSAEEACDFVLFSYHQNDLIHVAFVDGTYVLLELSAEFQEQHQTRCGLLVVAGLHEARDNQLFELASAEGPDAVAMVEVSVWFAWAKASKQIAIKLE